MTESLVLAALLSSPSFVVRDAATTALSACDASHLTTVELLCSAPDPEVAHRAEIARSSILRRAAESCLSRVGTMTDAEAEWWAARGRWAALDAAAHRLGLIKPDYCGPWDYRTDRPPSYRVRCMVGWCRAQRLPNPPPWSTPWDVCALWTVPTH